MLSCGKTAGTTQQPAREALQPGARKRLQVRGKSRNSANPLEARTKQPVLCLISHPCAKRGRISPETIPRGSGLVEAKTDLVFVVARARGALINITITLSVAVALGCSGGRRC